jgi:hypothetical protein
MARPKSEKKREPTAPTASEVLPMELQVGDRLVDETGEWEVTGRRSRRRRGRCSCACTEGEPARAYRFAVVGSA